MWLTPRVVEVDETPENFRRRMNSKRPNDRKNGFGSLTMQVKAMQKWPTPRTPSGGADCSAGETRPSGHKGTTNLEGAVRMWPTPNASDHIQRKTSKSWADQGRINYVLSNPEVTGVSGGRLNPMWVEWLMGWPLGWTDLKPLEMDRFQKWLDEHGSSSANHFEEKG
jgi:DNA (cytosine-5)-methyltransferase 1